MKILYVAPQRPRLNGIVNYAERFRALMDTHTDHVTEFYDQRNETLNCVASIKHLFNIYTQVNTCICESEDLQYDVLHAEIGVSCYPEFYFILFHSLKYPEIPIAITLHDPPFLIINPIQHLGLSGKSFIQRGIKRLISLLLTRMLENMVLQRCSYIFTLSDKGRKLLVQRFPKYANKIERVVPFSFHNYEPSEHTAIQPEKKMILSAGFWSLRRGIGVLFEALELLRAEDEHLFDKWEVFIGGGILEDSPESRRCYSDYVDRVKTGGWGGIVTLFDTIPIDLYEKLFQRSTIYVSTDITKRIRCAPASGNLMRAIEGGCAIIASDALSNSEFICHGENGYLYNSGDAHALANGLKVLMSSEKTTRLFQRRNKQLCRTQYSGEGTAKAVASYYTLSKR